MKTKIFHTKIWSDSYFSSLTANEKVIFLYYVFNEKVNQLFFYECPNKYVLLDTGINRGILEKAKQKFQQDGKIAFYKDWVFLINAHKYENYNGEKNDTAKEKLKKVMSKDVLDWYNNVLDRGIDTGIKDTIQNTEIRNKRLEKGIVKGIKILDDETLILDLREKFPEKDVDEEIEKMKDWLASKGVTKKDYAAFARNWLRNSSYGNQGSKGLEVITIRQ
jgi:hypothetical protein